MDMQTGAVVKVPVLSLALSLVLLVSCVTSGVSTSLGGLTDAHAAGALEPSLPRQNKASVEPLAGLETTFGALRASEGYLLRTIHTRPVGTNKRLPAIYFVQWLSCDSVEVGKADDGWTRMMKSLLLESGFVVARTEKAGVGDSQGGPCTQLDYNTESNQHRRALSQLFNHPWVDPNRVAVFGASMGSNMAPLIASGQRVKAIAVWGGGAHSWFERQLGFERRRLELSGKSAAEVDRSIRMLSRFYSAYLLEGLSPRQIKQRDAQLGAVWSMVTGTDGKTQYGRPLAFHQQAQRQHWASAWASLNVPVLAMFGEYDWYESPEGVSLIGRVAGAAAAGSVTVRFVSGIDHHFMHYRSMHDAFAEEGGTPDAEAATSILLPWLKENTK